MQDSTRELIRKSVHEFCKNTDLSAYRVRKIVEAELAEPCSWYHPDHRDDPDEDWPIKNYYGNLHRSQHVLINFIEHVHERYGIYTPKHVKNV